MAILMKGKSLALRIQEEIQEKAKRLEPKPKLGIIMVGNNPASKIYVNKKKDALESTGLLFQMLALEESIPQRDLENHIEAMNQDPLIHGILVQLPLPHHICTQDILQKVSPQKDVDGFHPVNVGRLSMGMKPYAISCTPYGIIKLLEEYKISIEGKHAVIVGRSNIVGKPMASLLLNQNATVTLCHSKTTSLQSFCSQADILVAAVGIPKLIQASFVKEGAVVIDVGINRTTEGKLVGDVDFSEVEKKASYITPVPGGVGNMTVAMLLSNIVNLASGQ
ncbi:MAG: bifunctional 5,10-methylenetetrahydrofolate dehydrogenase/5,10-methenyltetrahydrofolate cyclohydrolase [Candidatus Brocadiae bacterium]|nr:bifunctional 5,10-methylenetetrahydrofolate dehydrogenase/5,10-methenyltetrahydrofolate cyclohydrolase [Candidatus Brocadiia bacterium]